LPAPPQPINVDWDVNFRGNLRLWPDPTDTLAAIAQLDGQVYDEQAFLAALPPGTEGKTPTDTKRIRDPVEAMAYAGLALKEGEPKVFRLTRLGRFVFTFLGVGAARRYANDRNRILLAGPLIRGLAIVVEYRIVWELMRRTDNMLTNRELNAAMATIRMPEDIDEAVERIRLYRETHAEVDLGPLAYNSPDEERKAINPKFLLAGGGGTFITLERTDPYRRIIDDALPLIDAALRQPLQSVHISTDGSGVMKISNYAAA
jgi:hypothetical protein